MTNVFISYSRKDIDFGRRLVAALEQNGRDSWVDWEDIPYSVDWWREICKGIDGAQSFVFIISPESLASMVCNQEVEYARASNKRIVPVMHRPAVEADLDAKWAGQPWEAAARENWAALQKLNWLFFRDSDDFDAAFAGLVTTLDADPQHVELHTRLLVRARDWEAGGQNRSLLLRGDDLRAAETWLTQGVDKQPQPTTLHAAYLAASRQAERRGQRRILAGVSAALVATLFLAALSFVLFQDSQRNLGVSQERGTQAADNAATALANANTATVAQGQAELNAATATIAQGEALIQAATATVAQGQAEFNAATATVAQGEALFQAATAERSAAEAQSQALAANAQLLLDQGQSGVGMALAIAANSIERPSIQAQRALYQAAYAPALRLRVPLEEVTDAFGSELRTPVSADNAVYSADGRTIIANAGGNFLYLDAATGQEVRRVFTVYGGFATFTLSADERYAFAAPISGGTVAEMLASGGLELGYAPLAQIDLATGEVVREFALDGDSMPVTLQMALSPDGARLLARSDGNALVEWDAADGSITRRIAPGYDSLSGFAFDARRDELLVSGRRGGEHGLSVLAYDTLDVRLEMTSGAGLPLLTPDGDQVLTIGSAEVNLWDLRSGALLRRFVGAGALLNSLSRGAISPDGRAALTVDDSGHILLWEMASGQVVAELNEHIRWRVAALDFGPDGLSFISAGADNSLGVWDLGPSAGLAQFILPPGVSRFVLGDAVSGQALAFAMQDAALRQIDARSGEVQREWPLPPGVASLKVVSPDRRLALLELNAGGGLLYDLVEEREIRRLDADLGLNFAFSADSERLLIVDVEAELVQEARSGVELSRLDESGVAMIIEGAGLIFPSAGALSADGRYALLGYAEGSVRLFRLPSWTEERAFLGGTSGFIRSVALSPDGRLALSGSTDGTMTLWRVESGEIVRSFTGQSQGIEQVGFSGDGRLAFSLSLLPQVEARVWPTFRQEDLVPWLLNSRAVPELSCEERLLYAAPPYCTLTGYYPTRTPVPALPEQTSGYSFGQPTPGPTPLPAPTLAPSATPAALLSPGMLTVWSARYSADGVHLLTSSQDNGVRLWDAATGQMRLGVPGFRPNAPLFSPDGARFLTLNLPDEVGVWNTARAEQVTRLVGHSGTVEMAQWSPDGARVVTAGSDRTARVWDAATGQELLRLVSHLKTVSGARFSPDGATIMTFGDDNNILLWDAATGAELRLIRIEAELGLDAAVIFNAHWSRDGRRILVSRSGLQINEVQVWDAATGERIFALSGHSDLILFVSQSPDGARIVSNSLDRSAKTWDAETGALLYSIDETNDFTASDFSPDGAQFTTYRDQTVFIWDAASGERVRAIDHDAVVVSAWWSPDGKHIAAATDSGYVQIRDAVSGALVQTLR